MKKYFALITIILASLSLTSCNKISIADQILPGQPMIFDCEILTPESVKRTGGVAGSCPEEHFKANGKEGDIVLTCDNFDILDPLSDGSHTYDCDWATLKIEGNQVKIHFPPMFSNAPEVKEAIKISTNDGKRKSHSIIRLSRTFKEEF